MNNQSDNAAAPSRTTVRIPTATGDELEAWLYLPEGNGPHPAVVMAHGIGAIKAGGLAPFAERFCRDGFAAVVFDYRQWGGSSGQPREELSFPRQLEDYGTVIGWAAAHPNIDERRIFAWGTSFTGMYIVELAVSDSRLAGVIGQAPLVDEFAAARLASPGRGLRLLAAALPDRLGSHFIGLHELFDKVAEELEEFTDNIAERAVELGGIAQGTIQVVSKRSRLSAYPLNLTSGQKHIAALSGALAEFGTTTRAAIDSAAKAGDADTADLFTEVSRGVDKLLWLVEAHIQAKD